MRHDTTTDYAARIARALALIENTPEGEAPPTLTALAEAAALSPFHFHRVFRLMTGETLGAACQRLRLARSLHALADTGLSITEAAAGSGYATSQAFGRAMRQAVGASATTIRTDPAVAARAAAALRQGGSGDAPLAVEVVSLDPFQVVALRRQGPYAELDAGFDQLFATVFAEVDQAAFRGIWGVPLDDETSIDPARALFDYALDVDGAPVAATNIAAVALGGYAALSLDHIGSYDAAHAALDRLYEAAITGRLAIADLPPLVHYHDEPDSKPEAELRATLYLPLAG